MGEEKKQEERRRRMGEEEKQEEPNRTTTGKLLFRVGKCQSWSPWKQQRLQNIIIQDERTKQQS